MATVRTFIPAISLVAINLLFVSGCQLPDQLRQTVQPTGLVTTDAAADAASAEGESSSAGKASFTASLVSNAVSNTDTQPLAEATEETSDTPGSQSAVTLVSAQQPNSSAAVSIPTSPPDQPTSDSSLPAADMPSGDSVSLNEVITSLHRTYPLVRATQQERAIADGNQLSTWGAFDTKLKASSENGPVGYYETYRNQAGFETPIYHGGEVFAGYRNGGGSFQPWYKERETNDGGEFKGGIRVPLIRDRQIDARRAELWRATYDQQIANPTIRWNLIMFSYEAGLAYWKWVAAGQKYQLGQQWLYLAEERNDRIRRRVELEDLDPPELIDNQRAIAKRQAKLADSLREVEQAAIKLSLFLRDDSGSPVIPTVDALPRFPQIGQISEERLATDIQQATAARPDLASLNLQLQRLSVDYAEACNMTRPGLDAQLVGSQDVGEPTSSKRDKSPFELEAGLYFDVPLQRRKGRGKMHAVQAKMAQVTAKRRMVQDKVSAEVQAAFVGLEKTRMEYLAARKAADLAAQMADIERTKYEVGDSDLLKVALREQYALEASEEVVTAAYGHFVAFADYAAALGIDRPSEELYHQLHSQP
jgi:outer membrane protein TolC